MGGFQRDGGQSVRLLIVGVALGLWLVAGPSTAAEVEFGWTGTVTSVDPGLAAALPPGSGIQAGATAWGSYRFESTTPDANPVDPTDGDYQGALVGWTLQVGTYLFTHGPAGPTNEIGVFLDPLLTTYGPIDSVIATPALPGAPTLEADVFFLSLTGGQLPDDSLLLSPPDPADWDVASAGVFEVGVGQLIDIDLDATCLGPCAVPVPVLPWAAGGLAVSLLLGAVGGLISSRTPEARG